MNRKVTHAAVVLAIGLAAAQFVRPSRANPPTIAGRTIRAHEGTASGLAAVLDRACRDCHSNETVWPAVARIAPVSWLMAYGVRTGRRAVNFSEWTAYPPEQRQMLLSLSCQDATEGRMPGAYTLVRPEARLSSQDVETICAAARRLEARTAGGVR